MPSLFQIIYKGRFSRKIYRESRKNRLPSQKKGIVIKEFFSRPRKPNSAQRRTLVVLCGEERIRAFVPGVGTKIPLNSKVLIDRHRCIDVPGLKWTVIIRKKDTI